VKETGEGKFRKDLLYRLRSHHIRIPALRERMGDLPALVDHFLTKASQSVGKKRPTVPRELLPLLRGYSFPGNIRELESLIFDAVVRHQSRVPSLASFRSVIGERTAGSGEQVRLHSEDGRSLFDACQTLPTLKEASNLLIEEALRRTEGNQGAAARLLGLTRSALNRRLNRGR
jgi:DNA-binding NtrC family response regulator